MQISKIKLSTWFYAFSSQGWQLLHNRSPYSRQCGSIHDKRSTILILISPFLDLDQVKTLFLLCCLGSAWTSPDLLLDFSQDNCLWCFWIMSSFSTQVCLAGADQCLPNPGCCQLLLQATAHRSQHSGDILQHI